MPLQLECVIAPGTGHVNTIGNTSVGTPRIDATIALAWLTDHQHELWPYDSHAGFKIKDFGTKVRHSRPHVLLFKSGQDSSLDLHV